MGAFGDRYFSYIAAFGAFTDVSYQTPQQSKNLLGRAAYFLEAILRLPAVKAYRMSVTHDGETVEGEFLFGMVTNATSVGGFKLRAGANISMNDGLLEAVFLRNPKSALEAQALIGAVLRQEYDSEFVTAFRTTRLTVRAEEKVPWTLDGRVRRHRPAGAHRQLPPRHPGDHRPRQDPGGERLARPAPHAPRLQKAPQIGFPFGGP